MQNKIVHLAFDLCAIPSVTYEEHDVLLFCERTLVSIGLTVERIVVENSPLRYNLFAYKKNQPKYTVIFCTHLDTVAPFIAPQMRESELWGRGACDAKGVAAAMIHAVVAQVALGFDDVALLFTVGEETVSDGARAANSYLLGRAHFVVVGEPTDGLCAHSQKGTLVFDVEAHGTKAHSSLPHLGVSAIDELCESMMAVKHFSWPKNEAFGETTINFGEISGGVARNIIADHAIARAIARTSVDPDVVTASIAGQIGKNTSIHVLSKSAPRTYHVPSGFATFCAGFGSDAPYLADVGQAVLCGPGSLEVAHTEHEHISAVELHQGYLAYQDMAHKLRQGVKS